MKVLITGYARRQGTSKKTGNPYDFYDFSCVYRFVVPNVEGWATPDRHITCDPSVVPSPISLPCVAEIDIVEGRVVHFEIDNTISGVDAVNSTFGFKKP